MKYNLAQNEPLEINGDVYIKGVGTYDGTNAGGSDVKTLKYALDNNNLTEITWRDLVDLRNRGGLIPGMQYRITDYTCTTTQSGTKSAGHVFDVIVTADSKNKLNEEARAINHKFDNPNDDYFKDCDLSAWKIWYCLDNDTDRFAWAFIGELIGTIKPATGSASGTYTYNSPIYKIMFNGVVYNLEIGVRTLIGNGFPVYITKTDDYTLVVEDKYSFAASAGISIYTDSQEGRGVIYHMIDEFNNDVPYDFKNIQFYRQWDSSESLWSTISSNNTGVPCYTFSSEGNSSTTSFTDMSLSISNEAYSNVIKECISLYKQKFLNNICFFGNECYSNAFGNNCYRNTFGNECYSNTFGNECYSNAFGNNCYGNAFGNECYSNTFGNNCYSNTFGNNFRYNTFGNYFQYNTFGNNCYWNTFGNYFQYNTFGNNCSNIKFASDSAASTKYNYYQSNHFGDGCQYILFKGTETESSSAQVQNYNFAQGLQGTDSAYLNIYGKRNRDYETYISKDTDGTIKESVVAKKLDKMIEISHADLVTLKDSSQLIPGQQYRIIDYVTTTSETNARSAGHQFDIIVTADSKNKLNENARAIQHAGDTYFANSKLEAWELKYPLVEKYVIHANEYASGRLWDKDTYVYNNNKMKYQYNGTFEYNGETYYMWKDVNYDSFSILTKERDYTTNNLQYHNGDFSLTPKVVTYLRNDKEYTYHNANLTYIVAATSDSIYVDHFYIEVYPGNIYYMKDEFGNECPYDFKNIQFKRYKITSSPVSDLVGKYATSDAYNVTVNTSTTYWCYTFSTDSLEDASLDGYSNGVYNNIIPEYNSSSSIILNDIVFIGSYNYGNRFSKNCYNSTFGSNCYSNTFGNYCYKNTFGGNCYNNIFENNCQYNTFGYGCFGNAFGNYFYKNTFGTNSYKNTFGKDCSLSTFGSGCNYNTFGNECYYNTFGNYCKYNTFGNYCHHNTFGSSLEESQFGDGVQYFGITTGSKTSKPAASDTKSYFRWLIVENGVRYVNVYVTTSTSSSSYCQNVRICQGCSGTSSSYKSFAINNVGGSKQLIVCYNSSGTLKTGNLGDLFK